MTWAPFALAVVFGLIVSAGIYFTMMWPDVEPLDEGEDDAPSGEDKGDGDGERLSGTGNG